MTALILLHLWFHNPIYAEGCITPYATGVAEKVLENRLTYWDQLHPIHGIPNCLLALNENFIDHYAIIYYEHTWVLCYVVDVAQKEHGKERNRLGLVGEVDKETYKRFGRGPVSIAVLGDR
jgi:hypothetical protein